MAPLIDSTRHRGDLAVNSPAPHTSSLWPKQLTLIAFAFIAYECALWAVALKGRWFILIAPAVVCGFKALDAWRDVQRTLNSDQRR